MKRRTHEEGINYQDRVIREHEASGLSIRQFCNDRSTVQAQFNKWCKRLAESAASPDASLLPVDLVDAPSVADAPT